VCQGEGHLQTNRDRCRGYSPLWLRVVYDNADWPSVRNLDTALKAKVIARVLTVNCPIVFIEP
jgi:hypothetical protein